jgi:hypothetical protein
MVGNSTIPFSSVLAVSGFPTTTTMTREIVTPTFFTQSQRRRNWSRGKGATDFIRADSISRNRAWICRHRSSEGAANFIWADAISRNASTAIDTAEHPSGFATAEIDEIEIDCV